MDTNTRQSNEIYLLAILMAVASLWRYESLTTAVFIGLATIGAIYAYQVGLATEAADWLMGSIKALYWRLQSTPSGDILEPYEIQIGRIPETDESLFCTLQELGSFGVYAITGGGKTSFIHSIIHQLIEQNTPKDLRLVIADLKEGLDFRIYRRLPHLLFPIATSTQHTRQQIQGLLAEMTERAGLFKAIPEDRICNNLDDYHRLKQALHLPLPNLSRVVFILDESQNITDDDTALAGLVKLAKEGRAFGISLVCATQLPNVEAIPTKLKSQFSSMFCGYLSNPSHYYKIVESPREAWEPFHKNGKIVGRFIANIAGQVEIIQSVWIPRRELESVAREWCNGQPEPEWKGEISVTPIHPWSGSSDEKRAMLIDWFRGFEEQPTFEEFQEKFNASRATYYEWIPRTWEEING